jgi:hypothetical protein
MQEAPDEEAFLAKCDVEIRHTRAPQDMPRARPVTRLTVLPGEPVEIPGICRYVSFKNPKGIRWACSRI